MTAPPAGKGAVKEEGNELPVRVGGTEGTPPRQPPLPGSPPGCIHVRSSLTCQFSGTPSLGGGQLRGNASRRHVSGPNSFWPFVVGLWFVGEPRISSWKGACLYVSLRSQQQRLFLALVLLLIRSKTLGKSLALLDGQLLHW